MLTFPRHRDEMFSLHGPLIVSIRKILNERLDELKRDMYCEMREG